MKSGLGNSPASALAEILAIDHQAQFVVMAKEPVNFTSALIEKGGTYTVSVSPVQVWQDAQISATATGWKVVKSDDNEWSIQAIKTQEIPAAIKKFYELSKSLSRVPEADLGKVYVILNSLEQPIIFMSTKFLWSDNLDSFACAKGDHEVSLKENRKIEKRFSGFLVDVEYCYDR